MNKVTHTVFTFEVSQLLPVNNGIRIVFHDGRWLFTDKVEMGTICISFNVDELALSEHIIYD